MSMSVPIPCFYGSALDKSSDTYRWAFGRNSVGLLAKGLAARLGGGAIVAITSIIIIIIIAITNAITISIDGIGHCSGSSSPHILTCERSSRVGLSISRIRWHYIPFQRSPRSPPPPRYVANQSIDIFVHIHVCVYCMRIAAALCWPWVLAYDSV